MPNQNSIFHGPKEGLVDIKPLEIAFNFPLETIFYPLLICAVALFLYIIFQTYQINKRKTKSIIDPVKTALLKLDEFPNNLESPKDKAEYLAEIIKSYLFQLKLNTALSIDSSISPTELTKLLISIIPSPNREDLTNVSKDIVNILYRLETIEYSQFSNSAKVTIDSCHSQIREIVMLIDKIEKELKKHSTKTKKSGLSIAKEIKEP